MQDTDVFQKVIQAVPEVHPFLFRGSKTYDFFEEAVLASAASVFGSNGVQNSSLFDQVQISLPYVEMGAINSTHLFGLDELILFAFYASQRKNVQKVADIGANIGLHSMVLSKLGFDVKCFEPDEKHIEIMKQNFTNNNVSNVEINQRAVSNRKGKAKFVRVVGNTTGSHLEGAKDSYGDLEHFEVEVEDFRNIIDWADFLKIDVEGHEATLICNTVKDHWAGVDAVLEIGNLENAVKIFNHGQKHGINFFCQKIGWQIAQDVTDLPASHKEGSVYVSLRGKMPWPGN